VALCQARISTKPLWGFSSSNPYHSQSRAEQQLPRHSNKPGKARVASYNYFVAASWANIR
jgi:hypothetical protein